MGRASEEISSRSLMALEVVSRAYGKVREKLLKLKESTVNELLL